MLRPKARPTAECTSANLGIAEPQCDGVVADRRLRPLPVIFVHGNFIIGLPGETPATVAQTLRGVEQTRFDSIGGGPFFLTPGLTFERSPAKFGIEILDPVWRVRPARNFYDFQHEYFRTATLT